MEVLSRAREALAAAERACINCRRMLGVGNDAPAAEQGQPNLSADIPAADQVPGAADEAEPTGAAAATAAQESRGRAAAGRAQDSAAAAQGTGARNHAASSAC